MGKVISYLHSYVRGGKQGSQRTNGGRAQLTDQRFEFNGFIKKKMYGLFVLVCKNTKLIFNLNDILVGNSKGFMKAYNGLIFLFDFFCPFNGISRTSLIRIFESLVRNK